MTYVRVDAEIDISDIDWGDIVEHVEGCGYCVVDKTDIRHIVETKNIGGDWEPLMREFVYQTIGKDW